MYKMVDFGIKIDPNSITLVCRLNKSDCRIVEIKSIDQFNDITRERQIRIGECTFNDNDEYDCLFEADRVLKDDGRMLIIKRDSKITIEIKQMLKLERL